MGEREEEEEGGWVGGLPVEGLKLEEEGMSPGGEGEASGGAGGGETVVVGGDPGLFRWVGGWVSW